MPYALSYFISLVRFFGYSCPIWVMRILANANFFQNQKSHYARMKIVKTPTCCDPFSIAVLHEFLPCENALTFEDNKAVFVGIFGGQSIFEKQNRNRKCIAICTLYTLDTIQDFFSNFRIKWQLN